MRHASLDEKERKLEPVSVSRLGKLLVHVLLRYDLLASGKTEKTVIPRAELPGVDVSKTFLY